MYLLRQNFQKQIQETKVLKAEILQVLASIARNPGGFFHQLTAHLRLDFIIKPRDCPFKHLG